MIAIMTPAIWVFFVMIVADEEASESITSPFNAICNVYFCGELIKSTASIK